MLHQKNRITTQREITELFKTGRRYNTDGVLSFIEVAPQGDDSRGVVVIGKKFSLKAVTRNKQRRLFQAVLGEVLPKTDPGINILVTYQKREKMVPYTEAQKIITEHISLFLKTI